MDQDICIRGLPQMFLNLCNIINVHNVEGANGNEISLPTNDAGEIEITVDFMLEHSTEIRNVHVSDLFSDDADRMFDRLRNPRSNNNQ